MKRHNNALLVLATEWAKEHDLIEEKAKWYQMNWVKGTVLEGNGKKLLWDFEFKTRKTTTARRPDLVLEDNETKQIYIIDMACPMEDNKEEKINEKLTKYRQIAFEIRERRPRYKVKIVPVVVGCMGGGGEHTLRQIKELVPSRAESILAEMTKTVLWESESVLRKVLSGLIQEC